MNQPNTTILIHRESTNMMFPPLILLIGGGLMFFESMPVKISGVLVLLAGFFTAFAKTGYEVDAANKRYRDFTRVGALRFGGWRLLPDVEYIAIVRVKMSQLSFRASEVTFKQNPDKFTVAFQVNLILKKESPLKYIKLYTGNMESAMNYTMALSQAFEKPIYDCTTSEKKWLNLK